MKSFKRVTILFLSLFFAIKSYSQCATCKAAAETSLANGDTSIASGINIGVIYMLAILFFIFGMFIYLLWKHKDADGSISK